jgi:hypothetical protein
MWLFEYLLVLLDDPRQRYPAIPETAVYDPSGLSSRYYVIRDGTHYKVCIILPPMTFHQRWIWLAHLMALACSPILSPDNVGTYTIERPKNFPISLYKYPRYLIGPDTFKILGDEWDWYLILDAKEPMCIQPESLVIQNEWEIWWEAKLETNRIYAAHLVRRLPCLLHTSKVESVDFTIQISWQMNKNRVALKKLITQGVIIRCHHFVKLIDILLIIKEDWCRLYFKNILKAPSNEALFFTSFVLDRHLVSSASCRSLD